MGCNAWNHSFNCDCGWGGYNYGSSRLKSGSVKYIKVPNGLDWNKAKVTYETYVDPNARCPVCGDDVFFYQSPYGGRVFFDELGPPWDKHKCTDNKPDILYNQPILPPNNSKKRARNFAKSPFDWQPLIIDKIESIEDHDVFYVMSDYVDIIGKIIILEKDIFRKTPKFWRLQADCPENLSVSTYLHMKDDTLSEYEETSPAWITNKNELKVALENGPLSAAVLNRIGWYLSFQWRDEIDEGWFKRPRVRIDKAIEYFQKAADLDLWEAHNNLGVIYRDGLTGAVDETLAYTHFEIAAKSMNEQPMQHLANCYRNGIGVEPNEDMAQLYEKYMKPLADF